jgi:hypothetical protein
MDPAVPSAVRIRAASAEIVHARRAGLDFTAMLGDPEGLSGPAVLRDFGSKGNAMPALWENTGFLLGV